MKIFKYAFLVLAIIFIGCSNSDDNNDNDPNDNNGLPDNTESYVTALVNGERYLSDNEILAPRAIIETFNDPFNDDLVVLDIDSFNINGITVAELEIYTHFIDFEDLNTGFELSNNGEFVTIVGCNYSISGGQDILAVTPSQRVGDYLRITFIDKDAQIISGEFGFELFDYSTNETYIITEGVFNRLSYTIL